jgi:phospholipase/carboxylesterase
VLLSHGQQDPVVPFAASEEARQRLLNGGGSAQLLAFEGGHTIDPALLPSIANFVATCLG